MRAILIKHHSIVIILFIFELCTSRGGVSGASLGDVCTDDSNCTSNLDNSQCSKMYDCVTGTCACRTGYGSTSGNNCQLRLSGFGETCGTGYHCYQDNQECDSVTSRCVCTYWYDYKSLSGECTLRSYRVLTEACGGQYNIECLQALLDSGGECSSTCTCQSGYTVDVSESYTTCRAPRWGESCQWLPRCEVSFNTSTISDDDSSTAPTCTNNICSCPPSHDHRVVLGYNLCLDKIESGDVRYSDGETCTDFTDCKSLLCVKCPGASNGICMSESKGVPMIVKSSPTWTALSLLICLLVGYIY